MKMNKETTLNFINNLKGYEGYIQFSDRPIEDVYKTKSDIQIEPKNGFVYEAHFFNGTDSISIRQINDSWFVDETKNVSLEDTQHYFSKYGKVRMAQIWEEEIDLLYKDLPVLKLKKVVFAGFEKGDSK